MLQLLMPPPLPPTSADMHGNRREQIKRTKLDLRVGIFVLEYAFLFWGVANGKASAGCSYDEMPAKGLPSQGSWCGTAEDSKL